MNTEAAPAQRIRLLIQYDGAPFCGLQRQAARTSGGRLSVQEAIETALCRVFTLDPATEHSRVRLIAAGRTDTGVHARAMPAHFDCPFDVPPHKLPVALNKFLPPGISILHAEQTPPEFDARRDARLRWYRYQVRLASRREPLGPRAWQVWKPVDLPRVEAALALLRGEHDFAGFRAASCQSKRTRLVLQQATLLHDGELLAFDFKSRSFLQHQVRFMVGSLIALGRGNLDEAALLRIRDQFERPILSVCAPPEGLCLMAVAYTPEECTALLAENPPAPSF